MQWPMVVKRNVNDRFLDRLTASEMDGARYDCIWCVLIGVLHLKAIYCTLL